MEDLWGSGVHVGGRGPASGADAGYSCKKLPQPGRKAAAARDADDWAGPGREGAREIKLPLLTYNLGLLLMIQKISCMKQEPE